MLGVMVRCWCVEWKNKRNRGDKHGRHAVRIPMSTSICDHTGTQAQVLFTSSDYRVGHKGEGDIPARICLLPRHTRLDRVPTHDDLAQPHATCDYGDQTDGEDDDKRRYQTSALSASVTAVQSHTSLPLIELQQRQQWKRIQQQYDVSEDVDPALRVHKRRAIDAHERDLGHVPGGGDGETGEDLNLIH
jgi:hypothetical protein